MKMPLNQPLGEAGIPPQYHGVQPDRTTVVEQVGQRWGIAVNADIAAGVRRLVDSRVRPKAKGGRT